MDAGPRQGIQVRQGLRDGHEEALPREDRFHQKVKIQ